jgi:hypothetical protein
VEDALPLREAPSNATKKKPAMMTLEGNFILVYSLLSGIEYDWKENTGR